MDDSVDNGKPTLPSISISTRPHAPPVIRASLGSRVLYEDSGDPSAKRFRRQFVADLAGVMGAKPGDLKLLDPAIQDAARQAMDGRPQMPSPVKISDLITDNPHLRESVVHGLIRRGESANFIAPPKFGKSWAMYSLAWSAVAGMDWLGRFACGRCRVLLIDNELHPETLAHRLKKVAAEMGINPDDHRDALDVLSLRGRLADLPQICRWLESIPAGEYDLVLLDSLYRALPEGVSENDNAQITGLYNSIDSATGRMEAGWLHVHHASKGSQSEKGVTDVGSGAGAQSRAPDTHIVLRQHEEDGCCVLEAAVRSWAPIEPLGLRWEFPLWIPDSGLDTAALKGKRTKQDERRAEKDQQGIDAIAAALATGPLTPRALRPKTGMSKDRIERLLDLMEYDGQVEWTEAKYRGQTTREYRLSS